MRFGATIPSKEKARCEAGLKERGEIDKLDGLGQGDIDQFDAVRMSAFVFLLAMAFAQSLIQNIEEEIDGFVHFFRFGGAIEIRTTQLEVALGDELVLYVMFSVAFQFDTDPDDVGFMSKQPLHLLLYVSLEGGR